MGQPTPPVDPATAPPADPTPTTPPAPGAPPAAPPAPGQPSTPPTTEPARTDGTDWQAATKAARDEAAKLRIADRDFKAGLAKLLGLEPDGTKDPAKLAESLAAREQESRALALENQVLRSAAQYQADPNRLSDSRSLMTALGRIDPSAADAAQQIGALIQAHVEANPYVKIGETPAPAPTPPPVNDTSGTGASSSPPPVGGVPSEAEGVDGMRRFLFGDRTKR